jgi:hypothetical protein
MRVERTLMASTRPRVPLTSSRSPDADRDRAGNEGEGAERDVQHAQGGEEQNREDSDPQHPVDQLHLVGVPASLQKVQRKLPNQPAGQDQRNGYGQCHNDHLAYGD